MNVPPRTLVPGQRCQIWIHDVDTHRNTLLLETEQLLIEAPNWTLDDSSLILNGAGTLWRIPVAAPELLAIVIDGVPPLNNDHVLDPDGEHIFLSAYDDWQLYRAPLDGGTADKVTDESTSDGLMHFLHGVSPDGDRLALVGVRLRENTDAFIFQSAEIYTVAADGTDYRQITNDGAPADGPEFSPDGQWLYYNTEVFSGHAQVARMRPDGSESARLTFGPTVDWFPHLSQDGNTAVYLSYPPGTEGHPADLQVDLMVVEDGQWQAPACAASLEGGQGSINVNSWSPDGRRFAYVAYPTK